MGMPKLLNLLGVEGGGPSSQPGLEQLSKPQSIGDFALDYLKQRSPIVGGLAGQVFGNKSASPSNETMFLNTGPTAEESPGPYASLNPITAQGPNSFDIVRKFFS